MQTTILLALASTAVACLPLLVSGKKTLLNPAFFVMLCVAWSVLLKSLFLAAFRAEPLTQGYDRFYVGAASADVFVAGAWAVLLAMASYAAAFFLVGRRKLGQRLLAAQWWPGLPTAGHQVLLLLTVACVVSFAVYLAVSDTSLFSGPFSTKRFQPGKIGSWNRFGYWPYYFFKIALTSGSIAYVAAIFLHAPRGRRQQRLDKWVFASAFLLALLLAHFASMRMFILLVCFQVFLLVVYLRDYKHRLLLGSFAVLTVASFAAISYVHRRPVDKVVVATKPPPPPVEPADGGTDPIAPTGQIPPAAEPPPPVSSKATPVATPRLPTTPPPAAGGHLPAGSPLEPARVKLPAPSPLLPSLLKRVERIASANLSGRYFVDITKMAHVVHHFPDEQPYLRGRGMFGLTFIPTPDSLEDPGPVTVSRYLAVEVFRHRLNNITPGFMAELHMNFGWSGVLLGFFLLGGFHRTLFNHLAERSLPLVVASFLIVLVPTTTIILLNSSLWAAMSRTVVDMTTILIVLLLSGRLNPSSWLPISRPAQRVAQR